MKKLLLALGLLISFSAFAQKAERQLVQFTGIIINADSNRVVPYTNLTNISYKNQVVSSNYEGYFSFVVHEKDSIRVSSVGYLTQTIVIPENITNKSYVLKIKLRAEAINLPQVRVFPWASTDEFKRDFLAVKFADDDLAIAAKNLNKGSVIAMSRTLPYDGQTNQIMNLQTMHNNLMYTGSGPTNPLLNPIAWGSLIRQIIRGDKSRQSDDSN
ncbi:peptidase associated/transthyretin-like domain-containing protein [Mucilaginibacter arboris]|uniref:Carboxypeptidase-like regulatory domain-containing protein n=1 Tax=Mucilaginibacter arboris TaxID=2682090 RepID=A0A7K1SSH4_9SPHI|nr:hypothetical protein [Mucilaginibacter arboris]MVN20266.1 hypothetical protein [Mucilaginibacter arboris]